MVVSPVTMPPASKSMMSPMRSARVELVEIFSTGAMGLPVGVPRPVVKRTSVAAGADLRGHALDIVAGRALQREAGHADVLGIVDDVADRRDAAFARRAGGLDGVGDEAVADVARRRVEGEVGLHGAGARGVGLHEAGEALGELIGGAAVDELLLDAMQLGKFGEHGFAADADEQIGDVADGGIGGDAAEAVGAAALQADGERGERCGRALGAVGLGQRSEGLDRGPAR